MRQRPSLSGDMQPRVQLSRLIEQFKFLAGRGGEGGEGGGGGGGRVEMIEIPHQLTIELEMKQRSQSRWGKRERAKERKSERGGSVGNSLQK